MYAVRLADDGRSVATLRVHLAAIQAAHRLAGLALDLGDARLRMVLEDITGTAAPPGRRRLLGSVAQNAGDPAGR